MSSPSWTEQELRDALDEYESELRTAGKARNTIATYVQHPERFINWLVGSYTPSPRVAANGPTSRYRPLQDALAARAEPTVRLTFAQIEDIIGVPLPASARRYRPWWANETGGTHVHARAWLDAGRETADVSLAEQAVTFRHRTP